MRSLRSLLRQRLYVGLTLTTAALAVGANLVVFSVVNALWLRPRPVTDPDRVVMVMGDTSSTGSSETFFFGELGLQQLVRDVSVFSVVAGQVMTSGVNAGLTPNIVIESLGRPVETIGVTAEYFSVLGLTIHGRDFTRDDDRDSAAPVAIISRRLWTDVFGGRDDTIGRLVPALPLPIRIIGVAPAGFHGARLGERADLWIPRNLVPRVSRLSVHGAPVLYEGAGSMLAIARLQPWVTHADAQRLLDAHADSSQRPAPTRLVAVPISDVFGSPNHRTLLIGEGPVLRVIAVTSVLLLLGGCATLMALVLVHYERRRPEFAIRLAMGASRGQLAVRLGSELGWMTAAGCAAACALASWAIRTLPALSLPGGVDLGRVDLGVDWRVGVASLTASAATMAIAACLPLARFTHGRVASGVVMPTATAPVSSLRLRKFMLSVHVAATVIVLVSAALFIRTIQHGFNRGAGFDADRTLFVTVDVGTPFDVSAAMMAESARRGAPTTSAEWRSRRDGFSSAAQERREAASRRVMNLLPTLPQVEAMALGPAPLGPDQAANMAQPKFVRTEQSAGEFRVGLAWVGPEYLEVLGVEIIAGRSLTTVDIRSSGAAIPAVVSHSLASALWPSRSPLGRHLRVGYSAPGTEYEVVGVIRDFAFGSMRFDPPMMILRAAAASSGNSLGLALRTPDPDGLTEPVRRLMVETVPNAPRLAIATGRELVAADLGRERLAAWFFSGFGIVALALALGGVFGLIAYLAESRRREFGVRAALGATPADLQRLALSAGLVPAAFGVSAGIVGAAWVAKTADSFLTGIGHFDFASYSAASGVVLLAAAGAGFAAAWRVRRISPVEGLRSE